MRNRITINPAVHFGKPCVSGTRIPVQDVLEVVQAGKPFEDIIRDHYPELTVEDIRACVQYAMEIVAIEELHVETVPA